MIGDVLFSFVVEGGGGGGKKKSRIHYNLPTNPLPPPLGCFMSLYYDGTSLTGFGPVRGEVLKGVRTCRPRPNRVQCSTRFRLKKLRDFDHFDLKWGLLSTLTRIW